MLIKSTKIRIVHFVPDSEIIKQEAINKESEAIIEIHKDKVVKFDAAETAFNSTHQNLTDAIENSEFLQGRKANDTDKSISSAFSNVLLQKIALTSSHCTRSIKIFKVFLFLAVNCI